ETTSRQIARATPSGLALRIDRRRRDADSERRRSEPAAASTQKQGAELRGRASNNGHYNRRHAGCSKPVSGRERQPIDLTYYHFKPFVRPVACRRAHLRHESPDQQRHVTSLESQRAPYIPCRSRLRGMRLRGIASREIKPRAF